MKNIFPINCLIFIAITSNAQPAVQAWMQLYDGPQNSTDQPAAIAIDGGDNIYVTGQSIGSAASFDYDYATIKYSGTGAPLWTNRYNGTGNSWDGGNAVVVDTNGNAFVTGFSVGSGSSYYDYATIKYSSTGMPLWTNRYNGTGNGADYARAIAMDAGGNVFVTGYSTGSGSDFDYATIKYSNSGAPLWTNRYNGPKNSYDRANAVFVNNLGDVFVTGYSTGTNYSFDYATIKYSNAGIPLWTNRYDGPANGDDRANAIAGDMNGNVFVTGYSTNSGNNYDYATIAYSDAGVPMWTNRYNGPSNDRDTASAIAVDAAGNVFVTGSSATVTYTTYYLHYATVKYSNDGMPLWTNRFNGPGQGDDIASAMAVDANGNVFVTGYSDSFWAQYAYHYDTIAYSGTGELLWTNQSSIRGLATAMALDSGGNVLVTGYSADYMTIKYSSPQPIPLKIQNLGSQVVLTWTNATFGLQSAPAVTGPFADIFGATSPYTNPITGPQRYYRLSQ